MIISKCQSCRLATLGVITVAVFAVMSLFGYTALAAEALQGNDGAVRALEDSIGLLKWIGGAIVTGLASAVALLYHSLEKSNAQQRSDLIEGLKAREALISRSLENSVILQGQVTELNENVKELCVLHNRG